MSISLLINFLKIKFMAYCHVAVIYLCKAAEGVRQTLYAHKVHITTIGPRI